MKLSTERSFLTALLSQLLSPDHQCEERDADTVTQPDTMNEI